ncbi:MAG: hypothetical protein ABL925_13740 [Methylococcales bacterium]
MNKTLKKSLSALGTLVSLFAAPAHAVVAQANIVKFSQPNLISVNKGDTFTVDLIGTDFDTGPDGAAFSLTWNPSVLSYVKTAIANPPWDTFSVTDTSNALGQIDYVFLGKSVGDAGTNFAIASFTFNVLGNSGSATTLALSNDPFDVGFVAPGAASIAVNYVNSQVQVVPVPAAVWLFGSALVGMFAMKRTCLVSAAI